MTTDRNKRSAPQPDHIRDPAKRVDAAMNPLPTPMQGDVNQVSPATRAQEAAPEPYEGQIQYFIDHDEVNREGVKVANHPGLDDEERRRAGRDAKDCSKLIDNRNADGSPRE